jgi:hypothetical protein
MNVHQLDIDGASADLFGEEPPKPTPPPQPQPQSFNTQSSISTTSSVGTATGCAGTFASLGCFFCMK